MSTALMDISRIGDEPGRKGKTFSECTVLHKSLLVVKDTRGFGSQKYVAHLIDVGEIVLFPELRHDSHVLVEGETFALFVALVGGCEKVEKVSGQNEVSSLAPIFNHLFLPCVYIHTSYGQTECYRIVEILGNHILHDRC